MSHRWKRTAKTRSEACLQGGRRAIQKAMHAVGRLVQAAQCQVWLVLWTRSSRGSSNSNEVESVACCLLRGRRISRRVLIRLMSLILYRDDISSLRASNQREWRRRKKTAHPLFFTLMRLRLRMDFLSCTCFVVVVIITFRHVLHMSSTKIPFLYLLCFGSAYRSWEMGWEIHKYSTPRIHRQDTNKTPRSHYHARTVCGS
jgi:hypothetical protein